jgi:hypothetical protein
MKIAAVLALLALPLTAQPRVPKHLLHFEVLGVGYNPVRAKQGWTGYVLRCHYSSGRLRVGTAFTDLNGFDLTILPLTVGLNLTRRTRRTGCFYSTGLETYVEGSLGILNKDIYVEPDGKWFGPTGKLYVGVEGGTFAIPLGH